MKRFNKTQLLIDLEARAKILNEGWDFNERDGWSQAAGKSEIAARAYGEWFAIRRVITSIENGMMGVAV